MASRLKHVCTPCTRLHVHALHALLSREKAMKKTTKLTEIKKVARVRDKATGDYFEIIEFPVSSTERSRLELPPSVVVDASAFERRLRDAGAILPKRNTRDFLQAVARGAAVLGPHKRKRDVVGDAHRFFLDLACFAATALVISRAVERGMPKLSAM